MEYFDLSVPVIGILRGIEASFFNQVMQASFAAGLEAIEVTMNTEGALDMVKENRSMVPEGKYLGMGTIRNLEEAEQAIRAGAMFLVTPNLDLDVIEYARVHRTPVVAGALTPTEVYNAWLAGAALVKIFPCGAMGGARYIKDLLGPFDHIPMVAVGGVTLDNVAEHFQAGARGVGVSTALFGDRALAEKDINELTRNVKKFIDYCPRFTEEE